jgi:hypothetical protein
MNWIDSFIDGVGFAIFILACIFALLAAAGVPLPFVPSPLP